MFFKMIALKLLPATLFLGLYQYGNIGHALTGDRSFVCASNSSPAVQVDQFEQQKYIFKDEELQDKGTKKSDGKDKTTLLKLQFDRPRSYSFHEQRNSFSQQESPRMKNQKEDRQKISAVSIERKQRERLPPQETISQEKQIRDGKFGEDLFAQKATLQQTLADPKTSYKSKQKNYKKALSKKISKDHPPSHKNESFKGTANNEKIFKRAAFHIGIAYNTHFDKIQTLKSNFGVEDFDPTSLSKRLKMQKINSINAQDNESQQQNADKCNIHNFMIYQSHDEMAQKLKSVQDQDRQRTASSIGKEISSEIFKNEDECDQPKMQNE